MIKHSKGTNIATQTATILGLLIGIAHQTCLALASKTTDLKDLTVYCCRLRLGVSNFLEHVAYR